MADARYEMAYQRRLSGIRRSILWTAMTGSNILPACMSQRPRSFWSAWSCSSVCGTHSTLCRKSRARRIDAHIILGKSIKGNCRGRGVHEDSVRQSIKRGLERMKKTF